MPTVIMADRTAMEQIMGNLLTNAVAYLAPAVLARSPSRGTLSRGHRLRGARQRGALPRTISQSFEPFRRVGRQDVPGEGMGLAYVQMLVRRHGGNPVPIRPGGRHHLYLTIAHQLTAGEVHVG